MVGLSLEWWQYTVDAADGTASWLQAAVTVFTDAGLLILGALMLLVIWKMRDQQERLLARALLAPFSAALAYLLSEGIKDLVEHGRPCHLELTAETVAPCPPVGDWSFPSNHAAIAAAAAVGILLVSRRLGLIALVIAVLVAASRVFLGVHFPHDVVIGFLIGAVLATVVAIGVSAPLESVIQRQRAKRLTPS